MNAEELKKRVYEELEEVIDPELGIDIVNLGLVYDVIIDAENNLQINMTMTSMGCPMAPQILTNAHRQVEDNIMELNEINIDLVWTPVWSKDRMSRYAKIALGIPG